MKENKNRVINDTGDEYQFDVENELSSVVSATECTGLMYMPPYDNSEAESYSELYVVPKQVYTKIKKTTK